MRKPVRVFWWNLLLCQGWKAIKPLQPALNFLSRCTSCWMGISSQRWERDRIVNGILRRAAPRAGRERGVLGSPPRPTPSPSEAFPPQPRAPLFQLATVTRCARMCRWVGEGGLFLIICFLRSHCYRPSPPPTPPGLVSSPSPTAVFSFVVLSSTSCLWTRFPRTTGCPLGLFSRLF